MAEADAWFEAGMVRCDVVPAAPSPSLERYLAACASDAELWLLPNGDPVHALNGHELAYMAHEQLEADVYRLQDLDDGATVIDVGANVGVFSLLAAQADPRRRVVAVEPIPRLAAVVTETARLHGIDDRVEVLQGGLGPSQEDATFTFAPFFGALSSRHRDERADISRRVVLAIRMLLPRLAERHGVDLEAARARIQAELTESTVRVPIRPLSDLLRESSIERVDLLKIDVEGAELGVLLGVDEADWSRIERVAMEVNDVDDRLAQVSKLLAAEGFEVTVEDDPSASRVVPRRIAIVHASRAPLGPRGALTTPPATIAADAVREAEAIAQRVIEAMPADARPGGQVRVCTSDVFGTRRGPRTEAPLLEPLSWALAELLGVAPLHLAPGWETMGLCEGTGAA